MTGKTIASLLAAALLLLGCAPAAAGRDRPTYRIATTAWAGWSALDVANVKGFWRDQGLDVRLHRYHDAFTLIAALHAGKVDLSANMVGDVVGRHLTGQKMTILAEIDWSHGGDQIILKRGIDLAAMAGKPIGIHYDSPAIWYFMQSYFETRGLDFSQFRLVEMGPDALVSQFVAGRLSMIQHYSPFALRAAREGDGRVVATSADFPGVIPECLYGTAARIRNMPGGDIRKLLAGYIRGAVWLNDPANREAFHGILNRETFGGYPPHSAGELDRIVGQVRIHMPEALFAANRDGGWLSVHLTRLRGFLAAHGRLTRDFTVDDIFDNSFVLDVLEKEFRTEP